MMSPGSPQGRGWPPNGRDASESKREGDRCWQTQQLGDGPGAQVSLPVIPPSLSTGIEVWERVWGFGGSGKMPRIWKSITRAERTGQEPAGGPGLSHTSPAPAALGTGRRETGAESFPRGPWAQGTKSHGESWLEVGEVRGHRLQHRKRSWSHRALTKQQNVEGPAPSPGKVGDTEEAHDCDRCQHLAEPWGSGRQRQNDSPGRAGKGSNRPAHFQGSGVPGELVC